MSKAHLLIQNYRVAVERFDEILREKPNQVVRDAAIKRFEFTFDLAWKSIKSWLEDNKGIICHSPKDCFRAAYQSGLLDFDDYWLQITDWRNESVHTYDEALAQALFQKFPEVLKRFKDLKKRLPA